MPDTKISDLVAVTDVQDTDDFVLARAGDTNRITGEDLLAAASGGVGSEQGGLVLIQEIVVPAGGSASVDFSSIPALYDHLEIWFAARSEGAANDMLMRFNNDSGANYGVQVLRGSASSASAATLAAQTAGNIASLPATGGTYDGEGKIIIPFYRQGTLTRSAISEYSLHDGTNRQVGKFAAFWSGTAAINQVTLFISGTDLKQDSVFRLYGVQGALSGSPSLADEELDYVQFTAGVTISATTEATANTVVTSNAVTFDGTTRVCIEFFTPEVGCGSTNSSAIAVVLYQDGSSIGLISLVQNSGNSTAAAQLMRKFITPSSGSHTYSIRAYRGVSNGTVVGGTGVSGDFQPGYIRITRVPQVTVTETGGWMAAGETWTYASADSPTFTFTIPGDLSTKYYPGMRIKLTQTTAKYFIITKVAFSSGTTTITVYGGTGYTLANAAITSPSYSGQKAPAGFPLDPSSWTVTFTDSSRRNAGALTASTWSNPGSLSFDLPIGVWDLEWFAMVYAACGSSVTLSVQATLSTTTNSETDTELSGYGYMASLTEHAHTVVRRKTLALTAKTTYRPNIWGATSSSSLSALAYLNDFKPLLVKAVCAYL